jgi:hypothetical protein
MIRAVAQTGLILLLDPLQIDWIGGRVVVVEDAKFDIPMTLTPGRTRGIGSNLLSISPGA